MILKLNRLTNTPNITSGHGWTLVNVGFTMAIVVFPLWGRGRGGPPRLGGGGGGGGVGGGVGGGGGPGYTSTPKIVKIRRKNDFSAPFSMRIKLKKLSAPYARP